MTFILAFTAAGFLAAGFSVLAFRYARVVCLHSLAFWAFFVGFPLTAAWLSVGGVASHRRLVGDDLVGESLAQALASNAFLYVLYGLGLLTVAMMLRDGARLQRFSDTLARQRYHGIWPALFCASFAVELFLRAHFGTLIEGSGGRSFSNIPYIYVTAISLATSLSFGLFCYLAVLSVRRRALLYLALLYPAYLLLSGGRRDFLMSLAALIVLRKFSVGFRFSWRFVGIAVALVMTFIVVSPFFVQFRLRALDYEARDVPLSQSLILGASDTLDAWSRGDLTYASVEENVTRRGNCGVFLLSVASHYFPLQYGNLDMDGVPVGHSLRHRLETGFSGRGTHRASLRHGPHR